MSALLQAHSALPPLAWHGCALFLDFDGTLVDLAPHPDDVKVEPELHAALALLHEQLGGALAIVSGRPVEQIDQMLWPLVLPAAGVHGMERRGADGRMWRNPLPALDVARALANELAAQFPGLWLEEKYGALALHYRQAPQAGPSTIARLRAGLMRHPDLVVMEGKMVIEVKQAAINKGSAIRDFCAAPPFAGRTPVFIGDDTTDEAGFAWVQEQGGVAVKVGEGATLAQHRIASAAALRQALQQLTESLNERE
jgi:trehalose 6-phosphate phosphatase